MIPLKDGVSIAYKKKRYIGEISEDLFNEIYGSDAEKQKEKYQLVEPKKKRKDEPSKSGD